MVTCGVVEDRTKSRLQCSLLDLVEGETVSEVREGVHVHLVFGCRVLQELMEFACDEDEETPRRSGGMTLESKVSEAVVVSEDIHRHVEGDAGLPVGVSREGVLHWVCGKAGGDSSYLLGLLTPRGSGTKTSLKEVCDLAWRASIMHSAWVG